MGLVAPRHVGSSQTWAQTHVPCIGRWILNHCATREVQINAFKWGKDLKHNQLLLSHNLIANYFTRNCFTWKIINVLEKTVPS